MAVSYVFQNTQIHLFDINILPSLLIAPEKTIQNQEFQLLADKDLYNNFQSSGKMIKTDHFVFQGFPKNLKRASSLWRSYAEDVINNKASCWDLQIPLYVRLRKHELEILAIPKKDRPNVKIDSFLMLNSLGWSTHIHISLNIPLKASQVADLCNVLRDKAYAPSAYSLNGIEMTLKELFTYYRRTLFSDILVSNVEYFRPDHIAHLIFVDVTRAFGKPTLYYDIPVTYLQQLAKIIKGNNVVIKTESRNGMVFPIIDKMLVTKIHREFFDFSLTDFDQGTFTFIQTEALKERGTSGAHCMSNNTRDCSWLSFFWLESYNRLQENARNNTSVQQLLNSGIVALKHLKKSYGSRTSHRLMQKHKGLVALLGDDEPLDSDNGDLDGYAK